MAIKKKFISGTPAEAIDGSKLLFANEEAFRVKNASGVAEEIFKLDGSNVFQLLKLPQVSADPTQANELVRKSYLAAQIEAASTSLGGDLSALEGRVSTAEGEIDTLQSEMDAAEGRLDVVEPKVTTLEGEMDAVEGRATALEGRATALETDVGILKGNSTVEGSVDYKIAASVSSLLNGAPEAYDTLKEIADYIASDEAAGTVLVGRVGVLEGKVDTLEGDELTVGSVAYAIEQESLIREAAEGVIVQSVSDEAAAREAADLVLDGAKASRALDNLENVAINTSLLPGMAGHSIGGEGFEWMEVHAAKLKNLGFEYINLESTTEGKLMDPSMAQEAIVWGNDSVVLKSMGSQQLVAGVNTSEASGVQVFGYGLQAGDGTQNIGSPSTAFQWGYFSEVFAPSAPSENNSLTNKFYVDSEIATAINPIENRVGAIEAVYAATSYVDTQDAATLGSAQTYTDGEISLLKGAVSANYDSLEKIEQKIEFMVQNSDPAALDSLAEIVAAFQGADQSINTAITDLANTASSGLTAEQTRAENAEAALGLRIDGVESDLGIEETARIAGDASTLVDAKAYTDAQLDTLVIQQQAYEAKTLVAGDVSNGYIDVGSTIVGTPWVMIDGVMGRPGVDFTFSGARITFAGEWAAAGASALEAGDVLHVFYMKEFLPFL